MGEKLRCSEMTCLLQRRIFTIPALQAGSERKLFPLAQKDSRCKCSVSMVKRAINELVKARHTEKIHRHRPKAHQLIYLQIKTVVRITGICKIKCAFAFPKKER